MGVFEQVPTVFWRSGFYRFAWAARRRVSLRRWWVLRHRDDGRLWYRSRTKGDPRRVRAASGVYPVPQAERAGPVANTLKLLGLDIRSTDGARGDRTGTTSTVARVIPERKPIQSGASDFLRFDPRTENPGSRSPGHCAVWTTF